MRLQLGAFMLSAALAGCTDRQPIAEPILPQAPAPSPVRQRDVYLSVSDAAPEAGSTIIVAANVGVGDSLSVASFVARLAYDASALHFMGEIEIPDMMRVVNPQATQVIVAAASASGSSADRLFKLRFRVDNPAGLKSLSLTIDEMNDRQFNSQLSVLKLSSSLRLDRALVSGRVTPR